MLYRFTQKLILKKSQKHLKTPPSLKQNEERERERDVKRGIKIGRVQINFSNRWLYTFIAIGILAIIGVGVYALAPSIDTTKGYHESTQISVDINGVEKTLQEAIIAGDFEGITCATSGACSQVCIGTDCKLSWPSGGSSLWTLSGSDIYYDAGNVGVGTTNYFDVGLEAKTAHTREDYVWLTATCPSGKYILWGAKTKSYLKRCDLYASHCDEYCAVGTTSCSIKSGSYSASIYIVCGRIK